MQFTLIYLICKLNVLHPMAPLHPTVPHCTPSALFPLCSSASACLAARHVCHSAATATAGDPVTKLASNGQRRNKGKMERGERGLGGVAAVRVAVRFDRFVLIACHSGHWTKAIQWPLGEGSSDILLGVSRCSQVLNIRVCQCVCLCVCVENLR